MIPASKVVSTARSFVGIRFKHQGRDIPPHPFPGLDCVGVVAKTAHELKLSEFDWTNYQRLATWSNEFERCFSDNMRKVRAGEPLKPGMAAIFRQEQFPCHCGILGDRPGGLTLIHAFILRRKVVEERFEGEWSSPSTFMGAYAFHGVNYG